MMSNRKAASFGAKDTLHAKKINNQEMKKRSQSKCNKQQLSNKSNIIQRLDEEEATDEEEANR